MELGQSNCISNCGWPCNRRIFSSWPNVHRRDCATETSWLVGWFFQFNIVLGILLAYFSNYLIGLARLGTSEWRWMLGIAAAPAAVFFFMLFGIPRSPRWLAKQSRLDEARRVLRMTGEEQFEEELKAIVSSIRIEQQMGRERLFTKQHSVPIFLALSIGAFNQLSGINAVLYYLNSIFASAGFGSVSANLQAIVVGFTLLVFTAVGMFTIDRLGRRILLLVGALGTAFCRFGVAVIFSVRRHEELLLWLLVSTTPDARTPAWGHKRPTKYTSTVRQKLWRPNARQNRPWKCRSYGKPGKRKYCFPPFPQDLENR